MVVSRVSQPFFWLVFLMGAVAQPAVAGPILSAAVNGSPIGPYFVNFDNLNLGNAGGEANADVTVSFTGDGQTMTGNSYLGAEPYVAGNGAAFGDGTAGPDTSRYLTTGIGSVILTFTRPQSYLGFLWGSVDLYNDLSLYNADGQMVASFNGGDVNPNANGEQGQDGSYYVNIFGLPEFSKAVFSSDNYSFEFDNVSYNVDPPAFVPEPATLLLFAAPLIAVGFRRKRLS